VKLILYDFGLLKKGKIWYGTGRTLSGFSQIEWLILVTCIPLFCIVIYVYNL